MKRVGDFLRTYWPHLAVALGLLVVCYFMLFRTIGTMPSGYTVGEAATFEQSRTIQGIWENPINAPYKLVVLLFTYVGADNLVATRIASAIFAIGFGLLFYWIVARWFSRRIAFFGVSMFVGSSLFLHAARYGEPFIMQMVPLLLVAAVFAYGRMRNQRLASYAIAILIGLSLYTPGMIWFILLGAAVFWKSVPVFAKTQKPLHATLLSTIVLVLAVPLIWRGIDNSQVLLDVAALPATLPSFGALWENTKLFGEALVYRSYYPANIALYAAPLLNVTEMILTLAGGIALISRPRLRGNKFLLIGILVAGSLIILGGAASITLFAPFEYLFIAAGMFYLLDQWLTVFPRNPIARMVGVALLAIVVGFSVFFHDRAYFLAWRNAPETKQVFTVQNE